MEIIYTEEIPPPSGGTITVIDVAVPLKKNKNGSHKDGVIYLLGGIATVVISAAAEL